MARRRKGARVRGPYRDKQQGGWRVVVCDAEGRKGFHRFADKEEADEFKRACEARAEQERREAGEGIERTVREAIDAYEVYLRTEKGNKPKSVGETVRRLRAFLQVEQRPSELVRHLTPHRANDAYEAECSRMIGEGTAARPVSADTHRNVLAETKTWASWCVGKGWLRANPFEGVKGRGKRRTGKAQLRLDEARAWTAKGLELAETKPGAIAALLTFLLSLRCSEVVSRRVRDVDDGGRLLWVTESKTAAGRRTVEVPEVVRPALLALVAGRGGLEPLFPSRRREWVRLWVRRVCEAAGVPLVSAHGMRGTHMSLAVSKGTSGHEVARAVGHESSRTTLGGSYATAAAQADGQRERMLKVLVGGRAS